MEDLDRGWNKIVEDPKNRKTVEDLERKDGRERIIEDMQSLSKEYKDGVREPKCLELEVTNTK